MTLVLEHPRRPLGGYFFQDPSGIPIKAESLADLIDAIGSHRSRNGLPAGDPVAEVEKLCQSTYPWHVSREGAALKADPEHPLRTWINRQWRAPPRVWAEDDKANTRLSRCQGCAHYKPMPELDADDRRRLIVLGGNRLKKNAGYCDAHRWPCGLAVWMDLPTDPVPGCWSSEP